MSDDQREPLRVLVFSASLRAESLNTRLARLAAPAIERHGASVDIASMREFRRGIALETQVRCEHRTRPAEKHVEFCQ